MSWTRRRFLSTMAGSLAVRVRLPGASLSEADAAGVEPFPGTPLVGPFLRAAAGRSIPARAPFSGEDYRRLIRGIVEFFRAHQDPRGAIIDPFEHKERQYSTPAFALAAAALCASKRDEALLQAAVRAMSSACADLAAGQAADRHADFFTVLLVHADILLRPLVPAGVSARWQRDLADLVPEQVYMQQPASGRAMQNWNLVAAAGEFLRCREGYGRGDAWMETSLARQSEMVTAAGMYRDPNDPMAYDHFARLWALDIVHEGYRGPLAGRWERWLERAAWATLFMQSPCGELPCGGRSAHHQWNEAEQAVTCETFARRAAARGDRVAAGVFRRGAQLSLESIARWVRPSGELWIVKNRAEPSARHGYETYSFHSQYNLLAAAMLAIAWTRADETVQPTVCPADVGGYAFAVQPEFHKVFAASGGWYVEVETAADLHYNPTGIVRVHHAGLPACVLSDGITASCAYSVPSRPTRSLALGPEWQGRDGRWTSLAAGEGLEPAAVRVDASSPSRVTAQVSYRGRLGGGATGVRETIVVSEGGVEITHDVEGDVRAVRETVPVLVSDGESDLVVRLDGASASVTRAGRALKVSSQDGLSWSRTGTREPGRNGFVEGLQIESSRPSIRCRLTV